MWEKIFFQRIHKSHEAYNLEFPSSQVNLTQNTITITQMKTKSYRFFKMRKMIYRCITATVSWTSRTFFSLHWCRDGARLYLNLNPARKNLRSDQASLRGLINTVNHWFRILNCVRNTLLQFELPDCLDRYILARFGKRSSCKL